MAFIKVRNLTLDFPIYGVNSRSLKNRIIKSTTGGYLAKNNTESNLRYSFWYNIISVIIGLLSFYYYLTSLFTISNIYKVPA